MLRSSTATQVEEEPDHARVRRFVAQARSRPDSQGRGRTDVVMVTVPKRLDDRGTHSVNQVGGVHWSSIASGTSQIALGVVLRKSGSRVAHRHPRFARVMPWVLVTVGLITIVVGLTSA